MISNSSAKIIFFIFLVVALYFIFIAFANWVYSHSRGDSNDEPITKSSSNKEITIVEESLLLKKDLTTLYKKCKHLKGQELINFHTKHIMPYINVKLWNTLIRMERDGSQIILLTNRNIVRDYTDKISDALQLNTKWQFISTTNKKEHKIIEELMENIPDKYFYFLYVKDVKMLKEKLPKKLKVRAYIADNYPLYWN